LIATSKYEYKPSFNIYHEYFGDKVSKINKEKSFMCGDASSRQNAHYDLDLEFAKNLKIKFILSEYFFPLQNTIFEVDKYTVEQKEIIVMLGFPGSGKTAVANKFTDYINIESDTYKTTAKMLKIAKLNIDKSVIFNATNPSISKRKEYIDYAKEHNINIRCFYVYTSMSDSLANNALREKPVPKIVYNIYNSKFEMPTITKGFNDVIII
jgi:bifunctional polynucleotide phosphatase/kinase